MSILNLAEAAALVNVSEATIRAWVERDHLPRIPHSSPMMFNQEDVTQCAYDRISQAKHERLDALAEAWRTTT